MQEAPSEVEVVNLEGFSKYLLYIYSTGGDKDTKNPL